VKECLHLVCSALVGLEVWEEWNGEGNWGGKGGENCKAAVFKNVGTCRSVMLRQIVNIGAIPIGGFPVQKRLMYSTLALDLAYL
jgi:hypothetical protein